MMRPDLPSRDDVTVSVDLNSLAHNLNSADDGLRQTIIDE
jgi:hypothetical protein